MTANFMLLKLLLDRVDDRELGHLENERKDLVKKGAELRKALKVAREQVSFIFSSRTSPRIDALRSRWVKKRGGELVERTSLSSHTKLARS